MRRVVVDENSRVSRMVPAPALSLELQKIVEGDISCTSEREL